MTSLKLRLASIWLPDSMLKGELDSIAAQTTRALYSLLEGESPDELRNLAMKIKPLSGSLKERRAVMASNHGALVNALSDRVGTDKAVTLGREALFKVGLKLGEESRVRLSVGESVGDLILAARVLYKVLGISFRVHGGGEEFEIEVDRCTLAERYSKLTCLVLSAADEGVVRGLNPNFGMRFEKRITSGFPTCVARIRIGSREK